MTKNIQWKKSTIDYSAFKDLTDNKLKAIENGKIIGKLAVDSGQLDLVRNPSSGGKAAKLVGAQSKAGKAAKLVGAQSKAGKIGGKIGGKKHVESGHLDSVRRKAIDNSVKQRIEKRLTIIQNLYNNISEKDWFTMDDVLNKYNIIDENNELLKQSSLFNYLKNSNFFESQIIKNTTGKKKYYKKL
jgi:hypothetical protein